MWCNRWFDVVRDWEKKMKLHPELPVFVAVYEEAIKVRGQCGLPVLLSWLVHWMLD